MSSLSSSQLSEALIDGITNGDSAAFEVFYRMERNNLVHFINSYVHDSAKAEDLAQDSLLALWTHRDTLKSGSNLRAFTFTIARNKTIDFLKSRSNLLRDAESIEACNCLRDSSMEGLIDSLDLGDLLSRTFDSLPEKVKRTFLMSRHEGFSNREIAHIEKLSEKGVEYRISEALRAFRLALQSFW